MSIKKYFQKLSCFLALFFSAYFVYANSAEVKSHLVVQVHNNKATNWDYKTGWYGDYVDQDVIDQMVEAGMLRFTGKLTLVEAWRSILPHYKPGQKIAIKENFNNAIYGSVGQIIDAIPQPVIAVIKGLKSIGVREDDIWIYDVSHGTHIGEIPKRFMDKITPLYPDVTFYSNDDLHSISLGYSKTEKVHFNVPPGRVITDRPVCKVLAEATYLINMPIMKRHRFAGISGSFKNHFGSIEGCDELHWGVTLYDPLYLPSYSPLVDLYNNHNIKDKTVMIIMDGIYGAKVNNFSEIPSPWKSCGDKSPNSLFFSRDPVALDSVMYDNLAAEGDIPAGADNYLKLAEKSGLGAFEHRGLSGNYKKIDYVKIEQ